MAGHHENVLVNDEIPIEHGLCRSRGLQYTVPPQGKYRTPKNFDADSNPSQSLARKHVVELRKEINKHKRKRSRSSVNVAPPAESTEGQQQAAPRPPQRRRKPKRLSEAQHDYLRELLLSTREIVAIGVQKLKWCEQHSNVYSPDLIPGLEPPATEGGSPFRLMNHQRDGILRMEDSLKTSGTTMLANEMGLSKTPQINGLVVKDRDAQAALGKYPPAVHDRRAERSYGYVG